MTFCFKSMVAPSLLGGKKFLFFKMTDPPFLKQKKNFKNFSKKFQKISKKNFKNFFCKFSIGQFRNNMDNAKKCCPSFILQFCSGQPFSLLFHCFPAIFARFFSISAKNSRIFYKFSPSARICKIIRSFFAEISKNLLKIGWKTTKLERKWLATAKLQYE